MGSGKQEPTFCVMSCVAVLFLAGLCFLLVGICFADLGIVSGVFFLNDMV